LGERPSEKVSKNRKGSRGDRSGVESAQGIPASPNSPLEEHNPRQRFGFMRTEPADGSGKAVGHEEEGKTEKAGAGPDS
jgi:hypothetical protein